MIASLSNRISKLEQRLAGAIGRPSRIVTLLYGRQSRDQIDKYLSEHECEPGEGTMIVMMRVVEPGANGPVASDVPIKMLTGCQEQRHA